MEMMRDSNVWLDNGIPQANISGVTNSSGLNAYPAGIRHFGYYNLPGQTLPYFMPGVVGYATTFWSSDSTYADSTSVFSISRDNPQLNLDTNEIQGRSFTLAANSSNLTSESYPPTFGFSVRCVKDAGSLNHAINNTYLWSTGETTASITPSPTQTTTY